ncbi:MAG: hypothetical protein II811_09165 [Spirochaetaceae bacterium]|nr:hypothetical protein [Spirochaetaceae bacterium]
MIAFIMEKKLFIVTSIVLSLTVIFSTLCLFGFTKVALPFAITFGTTAYHFIMRLVVGLCVCKQLKLYCSQKRFRVSAAEQRLYKLIRVKQWKDKLPTYHPDNFDLSKRKPSDILSAGLYAETGHTIMAVLSFPPMLLAVPFGAIEVFALTSILGCILDLLFVIIQRYNRPRLLRALRQGKRTL